MFTYFRLLLPHRKYIYHFLLNSIVYYVCLRLFVLFFAHPFSLFSSLKMEAEKLAQEKTEIQRQYIMVWNKLLLLLQHVFCMYFYAVGCICVCITWCCLLLPSTSVESLMITLFFIPFTVLWNVLWFECWDAQTGKHCCLLYSTVSYNLESLGWKNVHSHHRAGFCQSSLVLYYKFFFLDVLWEGCIILPNFWNNFYLLLLFFVGEPKLKKNQDTPNYVSFEIWCPNKNSNICTNCLVLRTTKDRVGYPCLV